jgi:hypothetical protein
MMIDVDWRQPFVDYLSEQKVKDRLGDQRGGSEWELIKILLEGD